MFSPRLIHLFFFTILCSTCLQAQVLHLESAESRALSGSVQSGATTHSLNVNPSQNSADSTHPLLISLGVTPNEQGLANAYTASAEGIYYSANLGLSFSLGFAQQRFSDSYADAEAYIGINKSFQLSGSRTASIGARFRYEAFTFSSVYLPLKFYLLDLGLSFDLNSEFSIGATAINLLGSGYTISNEKREDRPQIFLLGASFHPNDVPISIYTSLEEQDPVGLTIHFGASYSPVTYLILRAGTSTDTGDFTAGVGLKYDVIGIDVGTRFGSIFGNTFTFGLNARW